MHFLSVRLLYNALIHCFKNSHKLETCKRVEIPRGLYIVHVHVPVYRKETDTLRVMEFQLPN